VKVKKDIARGKNILEDGILEWVILFTLSIKKLQYLKYPNRSKLKETPAISTFLFAAFSSSLLIR
jgi:hypothetical protein